MEGFVLERAGSEKLDRGALVEKLKGSCLCGAIAYCIHGKPDPQQMLTCHCRDCQQITGTGHARSMGVAADTVEWLGAGVVEKYTLSSKIGNTVESAFCGNCGSPIYKRAVDLASGVLFMHVGVLDPQSINEFSPSVEIWMTSKPAWDNLC